LKSLFLVLFLISWFGCSERPRDDRVLHLALEVSPNKLDPAYVVDVAEGEMSVLIFQGLVRFSPRGEVVPDLARRWTVSEGGRRYDFELDRRMAFSNGRRVVASDVEFSFKRLLSPQSRSPRQWVIDRLAGAAAFSGGRADRIEGLVVPDDSTVVLVLDEPFRPFLQLLAMPAARIVPREAVENGAEAFSGHPLGSGRWILEDWRRMDYLRLVPNPYHPDHSTTVEAIELRIIPEAFTRLAEFEAGSLDILKIPSAEFSRFLGDPSRASLVQSVPELRVLYIGLNNTHPPLSDVRVRRALNMAVDVDRMITVLVGGQAIRACGAIPPTLPGFRERPGYAYDPEASRRLLAQAGWEDGFDLEIWQRDSPEGNRILEAVQGYLAAVGVRVRLVKREWSAFKEAVENGKVDAFFLDWFADYPDGENFLYPLFHSDNLGGGGNRVFYKNTRVDSLIEAAQRSGGPSGEALYSRIDSLVYQDAPWIYLYFPVLFEAIAPDVKGYQIPFLYLGRQYSGVYFEGGGGTSR
jgi:ABC-type transport system substrate-binding protein